MKRQHHAFVAKSPVHVVSLRASADEYKRNRTHEGELKPGWRAEGLWTTANIPMRFSDGLGTMEERSACCRCGRVSRDEGHRGYANAAFLTASRDVVFTDQTPGRGSRHLADAQTDSLICQGGGRLV